MANHGSGHWWQLRWALVLRLLGGNLLLLVGYLLAARVGLTLAGIDGYVSLVWPASGVALAGILLGGYRLLPGLMLAVIFDVYLARGIVPMALFCALGVAGGAVTSAYTLRHWANFSLTLDRIRDVVAFIVLGAALGPMVSAIIGTTALWFWQSHLIDTPWLRVLETWWLGDAMGVLVITPFLLIWLQLPLPGQYLERWRELAGLSIVTALVCWLGYLNGWGMVDVSPRPWNFLVFPLVLVAAFRFSRHGAVTLMLIVVTLAIIGTLTSRGPFTNAPNDTQWEQLWLFMAVVNISALLLGSALHERQHTQRVMEDHRRQLRSILASVPGLVYRCRMDDRWTMTYVSPGCRDLTGYAAQELLHNQKLSYNDIIFPEDRDQVKHIIHARVAQQLPYQLSYRIQTAEGKVKWVWEQGSGVPSKFNPQLMYLEGVIIDINDRRSMEESLRQSEERSRELAGRLQVLLRELDHRVKNNLAGLFSLVDMYARRCNNVEDFAKALHDKLLAMKSAHEQIADAGWHSVDLATLVRSLARQFVGDHGRERSLHIQGPALSIAPRQVGPLAMVLQELFTNCLKHGCYKNTDGQVHLSWSIVHATPSGNRVQIEWVESEGPAVTAPISVGQGLSLIQGFCHFELAGTCEFHFDSTGFRCVILLTSEP